MKRILAILALVSLAACGGGGGGGSSQSNNAPATPPQPTTVSWCASNTSPVASNAVKSFGGGLIEALDVWNAAGASAYSVCANNTVDANNNITDLEIPWSVTPTVPASATPVVMYPELMFGWQPGYTASTTSKLPAQVSNMPTLSVTGNVTTTCNGACVYDTSFDVMFSNTAQPSTWPPAAEMMIEMSNTFACPGTALGTVMIDNVVFDACQNNIAVNSSSTWPIITYVAHNQPLADLTGLNIKDFALDAQNRGIINSTQYIDMVELGTEVISGGGTTSIKNFTIQ